MKISITALALLLAGALAVPAYQDNKSASENAKDAGKNATAATKKGATKGTHETKKGATKSTHAVKKGANKVKDKTVGTDN
jgi:hypothetical protein